MNNIFSLTFKRALSRTKDERWVASSLKSQTVTLHCSFIITTVFHFISSSRKILKRVKDEQNEWAYVKTAIWWESSRCMTVIWLVKLSQNRFRDEVSAALDARIEMDTTTNNGALLFLQGETVTGKTVSLNVLWERAKSKDHPTLAFAALETPSLSMNIVKHYKAFLAFLWMIVLRMMDRFKLLEILSNDHSELNFYVKLHGSNLMQPLWLSASFWNWQTRSSNI